MLNLAIVGGGSLLLPPILRAGFAVPELFASGSIRLADVRPERAQAMRDFLMAAPEYRAVGCPVTCAADLDEALDGADALYVTMEAMRYPSQYRAKDISLRHRFICSENLSINGAFLGARLGPTILDFARRMEKYCPQAVMLCHANPIAVYSGLVNQCTKIQALGVCDGHSNARYNLTRITGRSAYDPDWELVSAGVNHCAFIIRGAYRGEDYRKRLDKALTPSWKPVAMPDMGLAEARAQYYLNLTAQGYRRAGVMCFSGEADGLDHVFHVEATEKMNEAARALPERTAAEYDRMAAETHAKRERDFADFAALAREAKAGRVDWVHPPAERWFRVHHTGNSLSILKAFVGLGAARTVVSRPNRGAVAGMPDDAVLEYTVDIAGRSITPAEDLHVPTPYRGLIAGLSEFQTLTADALARQDPKTFADALLAYPMRRGEPGVIAYLKEIFACYDDIPPYMAEAVRYLN